MTNILLDQIQSDLKKAQLEKAEIKVSTLRLLLSEIYNSEIAKGQALSETDLIIVVQKELKKRKEAALGFRTGGREDQALKEEAEAEVLTTYLPAQISDQDLEKIVDEAISQTGASTVADMGKVIGIVMVKVAGQAEGARVSALVKSKLGS